LAGVGVAPAQVSLELAGQHGVAGMIRGTHDKGAQRTELRLDRIGPGRVCRREAQLHVLPPGPAPDGGGLVRGQVVQDHEQPVATGPGGPDRLQRGQGVIGALVLADHAPQLVIAEGVTAVEVADAVGAVVGRAEPDGPLAAGPAGPMAGADGQQPELVEGEAAVRLGAGHVLDPVQLGLLVRVGGLLPGPGPLEGNPAGVQQLPQPLPADPHRLRAAR